MTDTPKVPRLRRKAASEYLLREWGISRTPKTLAKLACVGGGPPIEYDGRIPLHTEEGLDAWARSQLSVPVSSTAEHAANKVATSAA